MVMQKKDTNYTDQDESIEIPVDVVDSGNDDSAQSDAKKEPEQKNGSDYLEQLQRLQAEFVNYKKRMENERAELSEYIKGNFILHLLPVIDDLERLVEHHEDEETCDLNAVQMIYKKMVKVFQDEGLAYIRTDGEIFDPECHEAMAIGEVDEAEDSKILEEWRKGYRFKERLIRPSGVKVGKQSVSIDKTA